MREFKNPYYDGPDCVCCPPKSLDKQVHRYKVVVVVLSVVVAILLAMLATMAGAGNGSQTTENCWDKYKNATEEQAIQACENHE